MRPPFLAAALLLVPAAVGAELAVLDNGQVLKVTAWRDEAGLRVLVLPGGGEVAVSPSRVQALLPDEIERREAEPPVAAAPPAGPADLRDLAARAARRHGVDPALVLAVVAVESSFEPAAVSPKGAQGLMQLMPETAAELGVSDAFDPEQNLDGGVRHLRELLSRYEGDLPRALAAYNAGVSSVERHGGVPPFRETRGYVDAVLRRYRPGGG